MRPQFLVLLSALLGAASVSRGQDSAGGAARAAGNSPNGPVAERTEIAIPVGVLQRYVGTYVGAGGMENSIALLGDQLTTQLDGQPHIAIFPESETRFFLKVAEAEVEFATSGKGLVTALTIHQGGHDLTMVRENSSMQPERADSDGDGRMLLATASNWVAQWDAEKWSDCWNASSPQFRNASTLDKWSENAKKAHSRLGKVLNRKMSAVAGPLRSEGKPPSDVASMATVTYDLSCEKAGPCSESVVLAMAPDGTWGIIGHHVRPKPSAASSNRIGPRPTYAELAYAEQSPAEKLDLYLPTAHGTLAPVVIWIHGGGFTVGDKGSMPRQNFGPAPKPTSVMGPYQIQVPDVATLTAKGYAVVSLNYRLGASMFAGALPALMDGKAAVRFLRANADKYHLDAGKFAVWGNSAGGYMAAMLGVTGDQATVFDDPSLGNAGVSSAVQAVVVWYGAEDRLPDPELSIVHYLPTARMLPPFRIVNGDADMVISPAQAGRLHEALVKAGATSTLTILPGAGHEDPAYMATQMIPTFTFLDHTFMRESSRP